MISISTCSMFPALAPPSPADFDPFPAPPRPVKKIASPSIPAKITQEDGMVRYPTLSDLSVTSRSTRALISWATPECFPRFEIAVKKVKSLLFSSSQEQVEECGGLESCKEKFDSLELLDLADNDVHTEVDDLEPCTQYVALGRTLGGQSTSSSSTPCLFTRGRNRVTPSVLDATNT